MTENDIYKVCELRCPACENKYEGEIECMQHVNVGDKVLDSCLRCGFLGDVKVLAFLALFLFCTHSWANCTVTTKWAQWSGSLYPLVCDEPTERSVCDGTTLKFLAGYSDCGECTSRGYGHPEKRCSYTCCTSQLEADSVKCEHNPSDPSCIVTKDTTLHVCMETLEYDYQTGRPNQPYMQMYTCNCKSRGGSVVSCNGKTEVVVKNDCTLEYNVPGSCAQNGFQQGVNDDNTGSSADCFAVIGNECYMRDKRSGNTFTCKCDGNCNYAFESMKGGFCKNPYDNGQQDSNIVVGSSGSGEPESSPSIESSDGGEPESSPSSSGSENPESSSAIDYTEVLNAIRANTQGTMNNTQNIDEGFEQVNTNLNNVKNAVNNASNNITTAINNASLNVSTSINGLGSSLGGIADTLSEWKGLWSNVWSMDSADVPNFDSSGSYHDTVSMLWDSILSSKRGIDSIYARFDSMHNDTNTKYIAFEEIYDWSDTSTIKQKFSNFFFPAGVSNNCPVFDKVIDDMPVIGRWQLRIDFGNLLGTNFDLCEIIRAFVRLGTLITILFGTIRSFIRAFSNGG